MNRKVLKISSSPRKGGNLLTRRTIAVVSTNGSSVRGSSGLKKRVVRTSPLPSGATGYCRINFSRKEHKGRKEDRNMIKPLCALCVLCGQTLRKE